MIQLELTEEERKSLIEILEADLSDLRMEISHTDRLDFRDMLKGRKAVLGKLLEALRQPSEASR
jgi:ribosome recycling factor